MINNQHLDLKTRKQFIKYCLVGSLNTFVGLLFIFLFIWFGISVYLANLLGYIIGFLISYILNSKYTFFVQYSNIRLVKFFIGVMISYLLNVMTIYMMFSFYPNIKYLSQILGVIVYTLSGFLINKFWAMK